MDEPGGREVLGSVVRCVVTTVGLLVHRRLALPTERVGTELTFGDGSRSVVFRETALRGRAADEPVVLVVRFRLGLVGRNRLAHAVFRRTCLVNTLLFAGFPGFHTKFWMVDPETGDYRGVYEWDGAASAEHYARVLSRVLALVCVRGSVRWRIVPRLRRTDYLAERHAEPGAWWSPATTPA